jgi:hypothetical protein
MMPEDTPALESGAARLLAGEVRLVGGLGRAPSHRRSAAPDSELGPVSGERTSNEAGWCSTVTVSSWFKLSSPLSLDAGGCGWVGCGLVQRHVVSAFVAVVGCNRPCGVGCG